MTGCEPIPVRHPKPYTNPGWKCFGKVGRLVLGGGTHICMLHVCNCLSDVCVCKCVNAFASPRICLSAGVKFAVSNKPVRILKVTRFWYLLMRLFHAPLANGKGEIGRISRSIWVYWFDLAWLGLAWRFSRHICRGRVIGY